MGSTADPLMLSAEGFLLACGGSATDLDHDKVRDMSCQTLGDGIAVRKS